jgi:flagellar hook-associated protein 3 FlgL
MPQAGAADPYVDIVNNPDAIYFVPETGDLLLGDNVYKNLSSLPADTEIRIDYNKSKWADGDLRPEHYFSCSSDGIDYNKEYLTKDGKNNKQVITFDVGFNQKLDVNITADKVYKHGIARTVDEMISYLEELDSLDAVVKKLEAMVDDANYDQDMVSAKLEAAKKAQTYLSDTIQKKFEHGITQMQGYLDDTNAALTDVGNKGMRLKLIENRLSSQEESFTTLATKNDEADLAELAVHLSSAELTYNASLNATAKLLQTTLLNYI